MGVIINEFEIVTEPQPVKQQEKTAQSNTQLPPTPASHNIEQILRHQIERLIRVWAH